MIKARINWREESEKKLYHFLLLDNEIIKKENGFIEYGTNYVQKNNMQYNKLVEKFFEQLCIIKFLIDESKYLITYWEKVLKKIEKKLAQIERQENRLDIDNYIVKSYVRKQINCGDEYSNSVAEVIERKKKYVNIIHKKNQIGLFKMIYSAYQKEGEEEKRIAKSIFIKLSAIYELFFKSLAFDSRFVDEKWICNEQELLDKICDIYLYCFNAPVGEEINEDENLGDNEEIDIRNKLDENATMKIFGCSGFRNINNNHNWIYYLDSVLNYYDIKYKYGKEFKNINTSKFVKVGETKGKSKKKGNNHFAVDLSYDPCDDLEDTELDNMYMNRFSAEQLCDYIGKNGGAEKCSKLLYEKEYKDLLEALWEYIPIIYERMERERNILFKKGVYKVEDPDFNRINKIYEQMGKTIRQYEYYEKYKKNLKDKEMRKSLKLSEEEVVLEQQLCLEALLENLLKYNNENKRNSLKYTLNRLIKKEKNIKKSQNIISDVNVEVLKKMMRQLKSDVEYSYNNTELRISEFIIERGVYPTYEYKGVGIQLLNFPNSRIKKYKTAAVIIDKEDIPKLNIQSDKIAWTYKGGVRFTKKKYDTKTYKADMIKASGGKVDIFEQITGTSKPTITTSHKFDLRKEKLKAFDLPVIEKKPNNDNQVNKEEGKKKQNMGVIRRKLKNRVLSRERRLNQRKYYQGNMRIDNISKKEIDLTGICFNNEENYKDAPILFFDDIERFENFITNL